MAAVLRLDPVQVRVCCEKAAEDEVCEPAGYNSPDQTVISGHAGAVERATALLRSAGARRVARLPVSAPFHCRLMAPVKPRLREALDSIIVQVPAVPVVSNVEATPTSDPRRIVELLVEQVTSPVRWVESIRTMKSLGITRMLEVGCGDVLTGLVEQIDPTIKVTSLDDIDAFSQVLERGP
jgi:[acyl-carrier-protein] S-malonyltransferase